MRSSFLYLLLLISSIAAAQVPEFTVGVSGVCTPVVAEFTDVSKLPGPVVKRIWDFGDGNSGTFVGNETKAQHNYISDGEFPVTLTLVMDDGGQFVSRAETIIVKPRPIAGFEASTLAGCPPLDVKFSDKSTSASGAVTKWQWDFGDGSSIQQNPAHSFSGKKDFTVSLIVYNEYNCKSDVAAKEIIKVFDPVKTAFSSDNNGSCSFPFAISFNNTSTGKGSISYLWDFGDGQTSSSKNPQHEFRTAGLFNVKLTAKNGTNCASSTASHNIYIGTPNVSISSAQSIACTGQSVNYAATVFPSSLAQDVTWYFTDNNTTANGALTSHIFNTIGTYPIKVKAASAIGCTSEATSTTTLKSSPVALFRATPTHLCMSPFAIRFDNISTNKGAGYEYAWNFGDGQFSTLENPEHTYASANSKYVTFTIKDKISGCESLPVSQYMDLREPSVNLDVVPQQGCKPLVIQATATANANEQIVSYTWDWGDNTSSTTTTSAANHFYINEGAYIVKVEITTENGCSAVSNAIRVQVNDNCSDDGSGSRGGAASGGFGFLNTCENKNTVTFTDDFSKRTDNNYFVLGWDFGDGTTSGAENPVTHTYAGSGTREYNVTVTRKDALTGAVSTSSKKMVIIDEKPVIYLTKTATCTQIQVPFRTSGIHAQYIKQYVWSFGDKSTKTISNSLFDPTEDGYTTHVYNANGKYPVTLRITDKLGCTSIDTYTGLVQISGPQADFEAPDILSCKEIDFARAVTDKSVPNASLPIDKWEWYVWRTGDAQPSTPTLSYSKDNLPEKIWLPFKNASAVAADYSVKLVVTDVDKCKSAPKTISRLVKSYWPKANFSVSRDSMCGSRSVNFYNGSIASSVVMNTWLFGDGSSSTLSSPTHSYAEDVNRYSVTLIVAEQNMPACKDILTKESLIKVVKPVADFDISNPDECPPIAINCINRSLNAGQCMWTFSEGGNSSQKDISGHIYDMGGDYTIKLHVEGVDGCIDEITKALHIKGPAGKLQYENTVGCAPFDFEMRVVDSKNVSSYSWDFGDGTLPIDPAAFIQTHTYTAPRKYLPNVIISSEEGCHILLVNEDSVIVDKVSANFQFESLLFCGKGIASVKEVSAASALSEIASYKWKVNDELIAEELYPVEFNCKAPGEYDVALTAKSKYGCEASVSEKLKVYEKPTIAINGSEIICLAKNAASFNYSPEIECPDAIGTYQWLINDSLISTNKELEIDYRQSGMHEVKLIATTMNGCVDSSMRKIIIDSVRADFTTSANAVCGGTRNILFTNTSTFASKIDKVKWDFGDGNYSAANKTTSYNYNLYGDVKAVLSVTTENGCVDKSDATTIHLYHSPIVNIKGNDVICLSPGSPSLQYSADIMSPDAIETYNWLINDLSLAREEQLFVDYRNTGTHDLKLIATTINGCVDSSMRKIIIDSVRAGFSVSTNFVCGENRNIFFTNTSAFASKLAGIKWDLGDGNYSITNDAISHNYNLYGDVKASLSLTTENGCVDKSDATTIHLYHSPIVNIKGNDVICLSPSPSLQYSPDIMSPDTIETYNWLISDSSLAREEQLFVDYRNAGTHDLKLIATTINGCVDSSSRKIIIDSVRAGFTTSANAVCGENRNIFFTNTSTFASKLTDIKWDFGDENYSAANKTTSHNYNLYGDVKTVLSVASENGCVDKSDTITIHLYHSPIVNIKGSGVICMPSDSASSLYKPDITNGDSIQSYSWRIDGASLLNNEILYLNHRETGKHRLTLIATTQNGCSDSAMKTITIDSVKADFIVLDSVRCGAGKVSFVSASSSAFPIKSYTWSLDDSIYYNQPEVLRYYSKKGGSPASLAVTTENNCSSTVIKENAVKIYENPIIELSGNRECCLNRLIDLAAAASSGDKIKNYQWMINNAPVKGAAGNLSKKFSDTGNYIVSYKAISEHGCADSSSMLLKIHPLPSRGITHDTTICSGSEITLRPTGPDAYVWSGADMADRSGTSLTVRPLASTPYYLTATNRYYCSVTDSVFVKVDKPVDLKVCDTQTICKGTKVQLSATGNTSLFHWDNYLSLNNPTIAAPMASPVTSTRYSVIGFSGNVCPDEKKSIMVNVVDNPIVSLGPDITMPAGAPVTLHAFTSGNVKSYLWNIPSTTKCLSCPEFNMVADHDVSVVLQVSTQEGCKASDTISVRVLCNKDAVHIPTAFTPNGDGKNDVFFIMGHGLKKIRSFRIFDRWGKLVFHGEDFAPNDKKAGWNGTVDGRPITQSSTFVYIVDAICQEDKNIQLKGSVLLIR